MQSNRSLERKRKGSCEGHSNINPFRKKESELDLYLLLTQILTMLLLDTIECCSIVEREKVYPVIERYTGVRMLLCLFGHVYLIKSFSMKETLLLYT